MKPVDGKYFTFDEYKTIIKDNQIAKDGKLVYLYATNKDEQFSFIEAAKAKGYSVLLLDGQLDTPCINLYEQKFEKSSFTRVDSDTIDRLIIKDETDILSATFRSQLPSIGNIEFTVEVHSMGEKGVPVLITQNEYMRRMKDISRYQSGMNFYSQMPDSYCIVLNSDHRLIKNILNESELSCNEELSPVKNEIKGLQARLAALSQSRKDKKTDEITKEERDDKQETEKKLQEQREKKEQIIKKNAEGNQVVHQLIDLALLQNGMLKGASLDSFIKRSVELIK